MNDLTTPRSAPYLPPVRAFDAAMLGAWLACKARRQARTTSVQQAAANLRKQGVPLFIALAVLVGRH